MNVNWTLVHLCIQCICFRESGNGLWIDGELSKGRSMKCDTFGNSPLSDGDNGDFTILRIDVFGFQ